MMSLETIRDMSREAAETAEKLGKQPTVFSADSITFDTLRQIPNLGDLVPKGWVRVSLENESNKHGVYMGDADGFGAFFVDASGMGQRGEAALTIDEFLKRIRPGLGYGIVEVGQFQIKVGVFAVRTSH